MFIYIYIYIHLDMFNIHVHFISGYMKVTSALLNQRKVLLDQWSADQGQQDSKQVLAKSS